MVGLLQTVTDEVFDFEWLLQQQLDQVVDYFWLL